jgi:hypothetical protein
MIRTCLFPDRSLILKLQALKLNFLRTLVGFPTIYFTHFFEHIDYLVNFIIKNNNNLVY